MITQDGFAVWKEALSERPTGTKEQPTFEEIAAGDLRDLVRAIPGDEYADFLSGFPTRVYDAPTFVTVFQLQELAEKAEAANFAETREEAAERREAEKAVFKKPAEPARDPEAQEPFSGTRQTAAEKEAARKKQAEEAEAARKKQAEQNAKA